MSSGGGKQPSNTTQTTSTIPKFAEPYAMEMLGNASALTNPQTNPYQSYQGPRVAGFNDLQNQAFTGVGNMQVAGQTGAASGLAGLAGIQAGQMAGQGYAPGQFMQHQMMTPADVTSGRWTQPGVSQSYMSPYMQNVVERQQREANRVADIAGTKRGFQNATSGAYGGNRAALGDFEANRNLSLQLGDIQAKGLQDAYTQGASQFNADEGRMLQAGMANQQTGLTSGIQNLQALLQNQQMTEQSRQFGAGFGLDALKQQLAAAGVLGGLGNDQYNQQMGILGAQQEAGGLQQEQAQREMDVPYQEYLNAKNFPYQQMGWMSDLLRGLPTDTSSRMYGYPNTTAQTAGTLGGLASLYMAGRG